MGSKPKSKKPTRAQVRRFLASVGWFVTMFSVIENVVQKTLWHFAGVTPDIAACIFLVLELTALLDTSSGLPRPLIGLMITKNFSAI
jgi:hypothetical protein